MKIVEDSISLAELSEMAKLMFGGLVKAVVDINQGLLVVDSPLHADIEKFMLDNGSQQQDLWGINIYPQLTGNDMVEFDSMINLRPSQGNMSRGVDSVEIQNKILELVLTKVTA